MSKVYFCGITQNSIVDIDELTKDIYQYFDGLVWIDHQSTDGTKELLESRKGNGEIISLPWMRNHGWSMQAILNSNKILPGDFIVICDTLERMSVDFCKNIKNFIVELEKRNINTLVSYQKIFMFKYSPDILFTPISPHCSPQNLKQNGVEMSQIQEFQDPKTYRYNIRGDKRPRHSFIDHFVKYIYEYKISNHLLVGKENDLEKYNLHEQVRQNFMLYCVNNLKIGQTMESLKKFVLENELDYQMKFFFNFEPYLNHFYCFHKLNHSFDEILNRHNNNKTFKIN